MSWRSPLRWDLAPCGALLTLVTLGVFGATLTVPVDHVTIQEAINAAAPGDVIQVQPGTYAESIDFLGKAITVESTGGPGVTIIDPGCPGYPDMIPECSTVTFASGEGPDSVLRGFTVTGGVGSQLSGSLIHFGGGVICTGSSPIIENNVIIGNGLGGGTGSFSAGAGIACMDSSATISNTTVAENFGNRGPGIGITGASSVTVTDCLVLENVWGSSGPGDWRGRGAISVDAGGSVTLLNTTISSNTGGLSVIYGTALARDSVVRDCGFSGVDVLGGDVTIINSTIGSNGDPGQFYGPMGGIQVDSGSSVSLVNSVVWGNTVFSYYGGAGVGIDGTSTGSVANSIVRSNVDQTGALASVVVEAGGVLTVACSNIEGGYPGTGNQDLPPLFVDPAGGDFHLQPGSPSIDAGTNDSPHLPAYDYEGDPRIMGAMSDAGISGCFVDIGIDEFPQDSPGCGPLIRGDCDGDAVFNPLTDAVFLLSYGFVAGSPVPPCFDACDGDDDGDLNPLTDGLLALTFGFLMRDPLAPPYPLCGSDPTPDDLGCGSTGCP